MKAFLQELLFRVENPARYVGGEMNVSRKQPSPGSVRFALCYPDLYEIGMSSLGLRILYGLLNELPEVVCERIFLPDRDMQSLLAERGAPLFGLESGDPMGAFDIVGFSISSELNFTNLLQMLHQGGIPLLSAERTAAHPLIVAGGNSAFNPLPLARFVDAFVIGEGEEAVAELVRTYAAARGQGRGKLLETLAGLPGIFVPQARRPEVRKRTIRDLDAAYFPVHWIVPLMEVVHDRISLEIMRGCGQGCFFCQAGRCWRPVRLRSRDRILELAEQAYRNSGCAEISLLSFSSGDHPDIAGIVEALAARFGPRRVAISFPSLRIDTFSFQLANRIREVRKTALTFAPESSERLRRLVGKNIKDEELLALAGAAKSAGWKQIKLYFMLGLPGEQDQDMAAVAALVGELSRVIRVKAAFNTFIPKSHTALQREAMMPAGEYAGKRAFLTERLARNRFVDFSFHPYEMSAIEGLISRGDETLGDVVLNAWQGGAGRENWDEYFRFAIWEQSLRASGRDLAVELGRRAAGPLPWDFIKV